MTSILLIGGSQCNEPNQPVLDQPILSAVPDATYHYDTIWEGVIPSKPGDSEAESDVFHTWNLDENGMGTYTEELTNGEVNEGDISTSYNPENGEFQFILEPSSGTALRYTYLPSVGKAASRIFLFGFQRPYDAPQITGTWESQFQSHKQHTDQWRLTLDIVSVLHFRIDATYSLHVYRDEYDESGTVIVRTDIAEQEGTWYLTEEGALYLQHEDLSEPIEHPYLFSGKYFAYGVYLAPSRE